MLTVGGLLVLVLAGLLYLRDLERQWHALQQSGYQFPRGWFRVWHVWAWLGGSAVVMGSLGVVFTLELDESLSVWIPIVQLVAALASVAMFALFLTGFCFAVYFLAQVYRHRPQEPTPSPAPEGEDSRESKPARVKHLQRVDHPLGAEYEQVLFEKLEQLSHSSSTADDQAPGPQPV